MDFGCRGKQRTCISFYKSVKHKASPPVLVLILKIVNHPDTLEFHMNIGTGRDFGLSSLGLDKLCVQGKERHYSIEELIIFAQAAPQATKYLYVLFFLLRTQFIQSQRR